MSDDIAMTIPSFRALTVHRQSDSTVRRAIESHSIESLPKGDVLIRVHLSSLNYKDALAATGHPGVARVYPHVPGIDACGVVEASESTRFRPGDSVVMTGYELGVERWGGWSELVRVSAEWVVPLPNGLSLKQAATIGTAGFTAAQSVYALQHAGVTPDHGEILVTGATGGVGSLSVAILSKLGYRVAAISGKLDRVEWLKELGAARVEGRDLLQDPGDRPLTKARWAGAIDTVGGSPLAAIIRGTQHRGCVTSCGVAAGAELPLTVYPFILRGVTLTGIDSALCPMSRRLEIWRLLSTDWTIPAALEQVGRSVSLDDIETEIPRILNGQVSGRTIIPMT